MAKHSRETTAQTSKAEQEIQRAIKAVLLQWCIEVRIQEQQKPGSVQTARLIQTENRNGKPVVRLPK